MNNTGKMILAFGLGAAIGALITKLIVEKEYEQYMYQDDEDQAEAISPDDVIITDGDGRVRATMKEGTRTSKINDRYKTIARRYGGEPDTEELTEKDIAEAEDFYNGNESEKMAHVSNTFPYVISIEQFSEEMDHFDKVTIYYYDDDDTLTDADEDIMTDVEGAVGEALFEFTDGVETVYVRNEKLSIDYEIICLHQSYKETVMGIREDEKRRGVGRYGVDED